MLIVISAQLMRAQEPATPVVLDVVAVDAHGQPVTNLPASDFQVYDNGKRQEVAFFHSNYSPSAIDGALGPHEYSNRARPALPPPTVVLFDLMNERILTDARTRNEIVQSLEGLTSSEDLYCYILSATGDFVPIHALLNPETEPGDDVHWTEHIQPLLDNAFRKLFGFRPADDRIPSLRFDATLKAVTALGELMAALPGRKNLIWITHGVPVLILDVSGLPIDMTAAIERFAAVLEHDHVAVYAVDQSTEGNFEPLDSNSSRTLQLVSDLTGGRYYGADAVAGAIRQARADSHSSYTVGYFPPPQNWNGKFHKIRINPARPGLRFRTRLGYVATLPAADVREQDLLARASGSPVDAPEIGLRAETAELEGASRSLRLQVRIDPSDVLFRAQGDLSEADLLLAVFQDDAAVAGPRQPFGFASRQNPPVTVPIHLSLSREERDKVTKAGIAVTKDVALEPTSHRLKLVVLDQNTGEYGSLSIPAGN